MLYWYYTDNIIRYFYFFKYDLLYLSSTTSAANLCADDTSWPSIMSAIMSISLARHHVNNKTALNALI